MISSLASRRRADEFARMVEQPTTAGAVPEEWAPFTGIVGALRDTPEESPRPEFARRLREELMSEAEQVLVPAGPREAAARRPSTARRRDRTVVGAAVGCVLAGTTGSMAVAAQSALPGDPLYGVKQGVESFQRATSLSDAARGEALLGDATNRLTEAGELSQRDTAPADAAVPGALEDFVSQAEGGAGLLLEDYEAHGTEGSVVTVRTFVTESLRTLELLYAVVPDDARPAVQQAADAVSGIEEDALAACPTCSGPPAAQLPAVLTGSATAPGEVPPLRLQQRSPASSQDSSSDTPESSSDDGSGAGGPGPDVSVPDPERLEDHPGSVASPPSRPPQQQDPANSGPVPGDDPVRQGGDALTQMTDSLLSGEESSGAVGKVTEQGDQAGEDLDSSLGGLSDGVESSLRDGTGLDEDPTP